jgi:flagellar protein FliS
MGAAASYKSAYRSAEIETLSQRDLLIRLFQGAERFLNLAMMGMQNRQIEASSTNCQKARAIFVELLATLNYEKGGEIAVQLRDLYSFLIAQITEANLRKEPNRIGRLLPIVATLREGWEQVPDSEANTSAMSTTSDGARVSTTG